MLNTSKKRFELLRVLACALLVLSGGSMHALQAAEADLSAKPTTASSGMDFRTLFGEGFRGHWTFTGEGTLDQEYDDNVFPGSPIRLSDNVTRLQGRLSIGIRKKRLSYQIHHLPQYAFHAKYSGVDSLSQQLSQELTYRLSARTGFEWSASASRLGGGSSSPFLLVQAGDTADLVFFPQAIQQQTNITTTSTDFNVRHRFTARSTVTADLTGGFNRFTSANGVPLASNFGNEGFSAGGKLGWDYEFVPGKKLGFEANQSYFSFINPNSHSHYESLLLRYSQRLPGRLEISIGAGPSYRTDQASLVGPAARELSYALNAEIARRAKRYTILLALNRGSQLGTLQGTLATLSSSISATRYFRKRWNTSGSFSYSQMQTLGFLQQTESYSANGSAGYQISPALQFQLRYSYVNQFGSQSLGASPNFDRNLYSVSAVYRFGEHSTR